MDRKSFLKVVPALGITGGLVLTGCSTGTGTDISELNDDAIILMEAAEREAVAIQTYNAAANSGIITTQEIIDAAILYRDHHTEHLSIFNELLEENEVSPVMLNNFGPDERVSSLNSESTEEDVVRLAMTLEFEAAQAYFSQAITQLQGLSARQRMGEIFPVEVAHYVSLKQAIGISPAINSASFVNLTSNV